MIILKIKLTVRVQPRIQLRLHFVIRVELNHAILLLILTWRKFALLIIVQCNGCLRQSVDWAHATLRVFIKVIAELVILIRFRGRIVILSTLYCQGLNIQTLFPIGGGLLLPSNTVLKELVMYLFLGLGVVVRELELTLVFLGALNHLPQLLIIRLAIVFHIINFLTKTGKNTCLFGQIAEFLQGVLLLPHFILF